jgi:hypothetical protein
MSAESAYIRSDRYAGFRVDPRRDHVFSTTDERQHTRLKSIMIHGVRVLDPFRLAQDPYACVYVADLIDMFTVHWEGG